MGFLRSVSDGIQIPPIGNGLAYQFAIDEDAIDSQHDQPPVSSNPLDATITHGSNHRPLLEWAEIGIMQSGSLFPS